MRQMRLIGLVLLIALGLAALPVLQPAAPAAQAQGSATFTIEETTFESHYPRGMVFTIKASSSGGDIARAVLFYRLRSGTRSRENADFDAATGAWVADPYTEGGGLPPWVDFDYWWMLTDSAGNIFETEPQHGVYADNTREWYSVDTEDITLYWYGFDESFGQMVADTMARMRPIFEEGWGRLISYKPLAIIFPEGNAWDEYVSGGNNPDAAGFTSPETGYTLQRLSGLRTPEELMERLTRCGRRPEVITSHDPETWRLQDLAATIVHETTHLYQSDFNRSGPAWWQEAQPEYFARQSGYITRDAFGRIAAYAQQYDLPTMQGDGPPLGVSTVSADGCNGLGYNMGEVFLTWMLDNYGGLETHRRILEAMPGHSMGEAIEIATGVPFLDLENQWRASLGLAPVGPPPTATPFQLPNLPNLPTPRPASSG